LVPSPSSNRDWNEYGPSKAPLAIRIVPLPSVSEPFQTALALLVGIVSLLSNWVEPKDRAECLSWTIR
jgi:hypothetical protein